MEQEPVHILVVDDDQRLRDLLGKFLADKGYRVSVAADASEARGRLRGVDFDLMILDRMMPGEDGLSFIRDWRQQNDTPVLMLTAMGDVEDRIAGLEGGADDYLSKPFEPRELLLRIGAILRRADMVKEIDEQVPNVVHFGGFSFDCRRRLLTHGDTSVRLTEAEAGLLAVLASSSGTALSRESLAARDGQGGNARTVDVQITRLRRKIEQDPKFPRYLQTVRGMGYMLCVDDVELGA